MRFYQCLVLLTCRESQHLTHSLTTLIFLVAVRTNFHGEQKVQRLRAWTAECFGADNNARVVYAYGDASGGKAMLRMAMHAFYRNEPWAG